MMLDLGYRKNIDVVGDNVELQGARVVDAGCGSMIFSKQLVDRGAAVIAVDPDPIQAKKNQQAAIDGVDFFETGAEQLPVEDSSVDGVFFAYSLHHVPASLYAVMFAEIVRVLKPAGFLYVIEPVDCPLNQVMKLFHDEQQVRANAQAALHEIAAAKFQSIETFTYHDYRQFDSFDDFASKFSSKSFNTTYSAEQVYCDAVRNRFEELGAPSYRFTSPKQVWFGSHLKD